MTGYWIEHNGDHWRSIFPADESELIQTHATLQDALIYMVGECAVPRDQITVLTRLRYRGAYPQIPGDTMISQAPLPPAERPKRGPKKGAKRGPQKVIPAPDHRVVIKAGEGYKPGDQITIDGASIGLPALMEEQLAMMTRRVLAIMERRGLLKPLPSSTGKPNSCGTGPDSFGRDLARANARLIVKAPELLDVLKQLIEISDEPPETATASVDRLEAALVRARGLLNELQPKENDNASTTGN